VRGTPEGRRLFAWCAGGGAAVGVLSALGAAYLFRTDAPYEPCGPLRQQLCKQINLAGFELHSSLNAAAVVGPIMGFLAFLVIVVVVLYSSDQHDRHH
jgi:hypothetical protein